MSSAAIDQVVSPAGNVDVRRLEGGDGSRWDAFVEACPEATFFHRSGWRNVVRDALGHPTWYLYAEEDGEVRGVLPLGRVRSRLFGDALFSVPFCVYGGIAAASPAAAAALYDEAVGLAESLGVDYLELRHREARDGFEPSNDLYVTFRKAISPDPEENLKAIPRKQRAMVRKGIKAGLESVLDEGTGRFYDMYSTSLRNLGTPVLPRGWFEAIRREFGDRCEVQTVLLDGQPVSSVMSFVHRDEEILPYYGGGTAAARACKANDFMYWEVMRRAAERGIRVFDYGRSKRDSGSYSFKKNWGFEPEPLHYAHHLVGADRIPDVNPNNPKYRALIRTWQRLPLPVSRLLGPMVARYLG